MSNSVLHLENICRTYVQGARQLEVLKNANFQLEAGELVGLIGPSGAGKSTLLHIAGLLDTPQSGAITIAGVALEHATDAMRDRLRNRHIGFIYQFHHLLPELTTLENVSLPQRIAGTSESGAKIRSLELLSRLGLAERVSHLPSELSGGEQQRVAIARALANKPSVILADEPTGNLDPATSDQVRDLFLEIAREEGVAALIATHNMALADRLHRVVTLREGVVVQTRARPQ